MNYIASDFCKEEIRNVVFDIGDVLFHFRWQEMLMDYGLSREDAYRVGMETIGDGLGIWKNLDMGYMDQEEVIEMFAGKYPQDADAIAYFIRHTEYMPVPHVKVWRLIRRLKEAGYRIYLLSNYPDRMFHKHTEYADFMQDIDGAVVSYMVHAMKPEPEIYETLLERYDLRPEQTLFFDDREDNVRGAWAVGMKAVQVPDQKVMLEVGEKLL